MNPPIIGESRQILEIRTLIGNVAETGLNILITGETGVGKGVVAQTLHSASPRNNKPFITVNCAALPETLLESELYGYSKGAFTGAHKERRGKFQMADKGVLFLDEIGDMPISLQSKILHVLQKGEFSPLGSDQEISSDVWLIAATNHDLEAKIKSKEFRADLFYRLNIIKIEIPPLRERVEDIPLLVNYYISFYAKRYPGREIALPSQAVLDELIHFQWPGNIRQLQNIIKKQIVVNDWEVILEELREVKNEIGYSRNASRAEENNINLPSTNTGPETGKEIYKRRRAGDIRRRADDIPKDSILNEIIDIDGDFEKNIGEFALKKIKKKAVDRVEREIIGYVLHKTSWNRSRASKILKVSYKTLLTKISELNLERPLR